MKSIKFRNAACASVLLALVTMFMGCSDSIPNNEIHYTSADGNVVDYFIDKSWIDMGWIKYPTEVVSNTYKNGKGIIKFKDDLKEISYAAFAHSNSNTKNLKTIRIPESVTRIGFGAFAGSGLDSINIPENVTFIGSAAFQYCKNLISVTIPNNVKEIEGGLFWGCSNLTSVHLPDGITKIPNTIFYGCSSLSSVEIPESVTLIDTDAFQDCTSLRHIVIPNKVTRIESCAFEGCDNLESVILGSNVQEIATTAFGNCKRLSEVHFLCTTPPYANRYSGYPLRTDVTLYVPRGCKEAYSQADFWNEFAHIIEE